MSLQKKRYLKYRDTRLFSWNKIEGEQVKIKNRDKMKNNIVKKKTQYDFNNFYIRFDYILSAYKQIHLQIRTYDNYLWFLCTIIFV